jgi:hypothetical protein
MPAQLKNGVQGSSGGPRPNSGRPPDWLKEKCKTIVDRRELIEFLGRVAAGEKVDRYVTEFGKSVKVQASVKDRIAAVKELVDRGFGKPDQIHDVQITFVNEVVLKVMEVLNRTIPDNCPHCRKALKLRPETIRELEALSHQF